MSVVAFSGRARPRRTAAKACLSVVLLAAFSVPAPAGYGPLADNGTIGDVHAGRFASASDGGSGNTGAGVTSPGDRGLSELNFGLRAGSSVGQHAGVEERDSEYEVESESRLGLTAGLFVYWPVTHRFALQQEVLYTQKGSYQTIGVEILEIPTVLDVTYEMDYIELPMLLRFSWLTWSDGALYSLTGTAMSLKIRDRYVLEGEIDDGEQVVPLQAEADMSEVDMFDFSLVYGMGCELEMWGSTVQIEYRFAAGWHTLQMPTYAYVPFEDEEILIENDPVPLKNHAHSVTLGVRF
ncbi:MAG: outer membrane beta-barrel protein [Candidatus Eisenbacteria bacterium]|nr:outer membrane beta-barrel protein [Candidatus Eisenbacteria bacterium]